MCSKCSLPRLCAWQCTGSLAPLLQAQEHHFSPDELSGVITVPQRSVTRIKAALPRLSSTESCLCSPDRALMRNSTPLPRHIIPFPTFFGLFHFYSTPLWFDLIVKGLRMDCFWLYSLFSRNILVHHFNIHFFSVLSSSSCESRMVHQKIKSIAILIWLIESTPQDNCFHNCTILTAVKE